MASLRDSVKDYQEELRDGIAWVAFWKEGRSWNAELFHLEVDGTLEPFDRSRLEEIKAADPTAVILNGYYCGHLGENMSLDELTAGVRYHYENSMNDLDGFIGAHDDRLPPEVIEEARAAAHAAGLPFSEKPYRDGEDFDPYIFDGSMSIEDYELMQLASTKDTDRLFAMLPYKTLSFSKIEGRHGTFAFLDKSEDRSRNIRKARPSVRAQLTADKKTTAPKKAAAKRKNHDLEV